MPAMETTPTTTIFEGVRKEPTFATMSALTDRDTNIQPTSSQQGEAHAGAKTQAQEKTQYPSTMQQKLFQINEKQGQSYVSPSDAILSPASQKLSNMKQRQINKQGSKNPSARTLFSRTASSCSTGSDGMDTTIEKGQ